MPGRKTKNSGGGRAFPSPPEKGKFMKKIHSKLRRGAALSLAAILLLLSCACSRGGSAGTESGSGGEEQTSAETGPTGLPDIERHIHAISELNTTEYPLDSAAGEEQAARLAKNYRESYALSGSSLSASQPYYPRIKKLKDGSYFLIFHNGDHGGNVYYATSTDCVNWSSAKILFAQKAVTANGRKDTLMYMTPDACVLSDGRILAVTSYRLDYPNYTDYIEGNGVSIKISEDGGKTWGEEQVVFVGTNWEPSALEADNGEILIFFTATAPSIYKYGVKNFEYRSSGVGCVRSSDGGKTWTPNVTGAPFLPQYVMRQYTHTFDNGIPHYTDQMPVALQLNNGTIALAVESQFSSDSIKFSISWSNDYFAEDVGMDKTGPDNRKNNLFFCGGPYLAQFDSGEVVLTYHHGPIFRYRLADATAHNFYDEVILYERGSAGYWGSVEKVSSHSVVMTVGIKDDYSALQVARMYLNHRLHAHKISPSVIADTTEWENSTDALFCGSKSQAQVAVRVGYDDENVYLLAERLDRQITSDDTMAFYLDDGSEKGFYRMTLGNDGLLSLDHKEKNAGAAEAVDATAEGIRVAVYTDGTIDDRLDTDKGMIYEIAFPRTLLKGEGQLRFLFDLNNCDRKGADPVTEAGQPDANFSDKGKWFIATFE